MFPIIQLSLTSSMLLSMVEKLPLSGAVERIIILGTINIDCIASDLPFSANSTSKALILSLVMLLTEEKADEMLILALLYILS